MALRETREAQSFEPSKRIPNSQSNGRSAASRVTPANPMRKPWSQKASRWSRYMTSAALHRTPNSNIPNLRIQADLSSKDSVLAAISGSAAVFGVTNYWEYNSLEAEVSQGRNLADASKEAGVEHLIWSSLPYVSKVTEGKLNKLHHFDSKAMVEEYINEVGVPASFVLAGFFMANLPSWTKLADDGANYSLALMLPSNTSIPLLDVPRDYGKFVAACLANPQATQGKRILATTDWETPADICDAFEQVRGKKCIFEEIPEDKWPGGEEIFENMLMVRDYAYYGPDEKGARKDVKESQDVVEKLGVFEGFGTFRSFLEEFDAKAK